MTAPLRHKFPHFGGARSASPTSLFPAMSGPRLTQPSENGANASATLFISVSPGVVAGRDDSAGWWAGREIVAQISNLLCRRLPVGRPFEGGSGGGLEIRDTAGWKPALLW